MKFKKLTSLALSAVLMTGLMTGCGSKNNASSEEIVTEITEPVEISFWHAMSGDLEKTLEKLTDKFMEANPNITVTLQNQSTYNDLQQKMTATLASPKDLPTLTQAYPHWMINAMQDELLVDLKPYIENETIGSENYNDMLEGFKTASEIDGKIYGMPFNKSTEVIWYNKTLFDELGLEVPTTFEEFAQVAKTITEKKGIVGAGFDALNNFYTTYLKNKGVDFNSETDVTSAESVEAANYYLDGIKEGYFRIAGTDMYLSGPFAAEQLGMYVGSNAGESFVKQGVDGKFEIGVAPYPAESVMQQGTDLYMFSNATAEQRTAAFEFLKFLTSTENQITWGVETGYIPATHAAISSDEYKNSGSLVSSILEEATSKNLFINDVAQGVDSAYNESRVVMEDILADKNSDVKSKLEAYRNTLMGIYE
ncbi:ABC transporter substrate-binding protein [Romboutsia sp.]|jgi:multiple sugar transport system substrate-binding protein|uniref:ABC transporter substrate-binding protein n=1 Tax=Romboutsia sp. TaxID=1965302 RepID=UPI00216C6464|nr:ABC transporter substrate-binding protein [Romboutsia sp.]MCI9061430.1 ABC transporter substrate-binding protein [Romboutsia sp.]